MPSCQGKKRSQTTDRLSGEGDGSEGEETPPGSDGDGGGEGEGGEAKSSLPFPCAGVRSQVGR